MYTAGFVRELLLTAKDSKDERLTVEALKEYTEAMLDVFDKDHDGMGRHGRGMNCGKSGSCESSVVYLMCLFQDVSVCVSWVKFYPLRKTFCANFGDGRS